MADVSRESEVELQTMWKLFLMLGRALINTVLTVLCTGTTYLIAAVNQFSAATITAIATNQVEDYANMVAATLSMKGYYRRLALWAAPASAGSD